MHRPDNSMFPPREKMLELYRELRGQATDPEARWVLRLKELRVEHDCSILEAERRALSDPAVRKWAQKQIDTVPRCRKMAYQHLRANREASLIVRHGDTFKISIPDA